MGDIVESHAYNFKKEIGYDLFAQCEAIADKLHLHRSPSPRVGDKMTELDAKYYAEILHVHQQVKDEEGDEHPTALKLLALEMQNENNLVAAQQEEVARCPSEQSSVDDTRDEKLRDFCTGIVGESDESQSLEDGSAATATATATATAAAAASSSSSKSAEAEAAAAKELVDEENRIVKEELARIDIDSLPAMRSLSNALATQKLVSQSLPLGRIHSHSTHKHTSHITHHTSHITHHTSHITHHTSHITHHTSHTNTHTHHTSHITHHTSHITHHIHTQIAHVDQTLHPTHLRQLILPYIL